MSSLRTKIVFLVEGSIMQGMDEVFEEHKMAKSESPAMDENIDDHSTVQPGRQEDQASPIQVRSAGLYFLLVIIYSR